MKVRLLIAKVILKWRWWKYRILADHVKQKKGLPESTLIRNGELQVTGKFTCGENCKFYNGVTIKAGAPIEIGRYTSISGPNTDISNKINNVKIGSFCSIARNVTIQEFNHDYENFTTYYIEQNLLNNQNSGERISKGPITIGDDVWIGAQCVILSGSNIGTGAVIAANSVVIGEIPPYSIVGGTPAKLIKYRFSQDKIERLLESNWVSRIDENNYHELSKFLNE